MPIPQRRCILARRAGRYPSQRVLVITIPAIAIVAACSGSSPQAPLEARIPTTLEIDPGAVVVFTGDVVQFEARVRDGRGARVPTQVFWTASGGTISERGHFEAGEAPGVYSVHAQVQADGVSLATSAGVTITEAPSDLPADDSDDSQPGKGQVQGSPIVTISPTSVELSPGEQQQFSVAVTDSSGDPVSASVTWKTTGGRISSSGLLTASSTPGTYSVTAKVESTRGDADVTVVEPAAPETDDEPVPTDEEGESGDGSDAPPESPESSDPPVDAPAGVPISPGESIQSAVDANPEGTTFILQSGVHRRQSVEPRNGNTFLGEQGTVLDGEGTTEFAFLPTANDVTIRGLKVINYDNPLQMGAIHAGGHGKPETTGWIVADNEVAYNAGAGVRTSNTMHVIGNHVHHNGQIGITGRANNSLIEDNEIAYNNTRGIDPGWEAGGTKFVHSDGLTIRGNHSHHNDGPGLWTDMNNINVVYEDNLVEHNTGTGIFHEVSYKAVIRNNTVRNNGHQRGRWLYGAGILVAHSSDVEVYGNVVENNFVGIAGIDQNRRDPSDEMHGPWTLKNLWVHGNDIRQPDSWRVAGLNREDGAIDTNNLRFDFNDYRLSQDSEFELNGGLSVEQWQSAGHDLSGTFTY